MKLTMFSKALIAITIGSVTFAGLWQLGKLVGPSITGTPSTVNTTGTPGTPAAQPKPRATKGPLGGPDNPLKVSLVSFHGYAPALVANGDSLETQPGSIFAEKGVNVQFTLNDDIPTLATLFESGAAQCAWRTSDFWAQEQPNLRNAQHDAKAVMIGGDAIISSNPAVNSVEDLAGHSVALLQFTPSHGLLIDALENSSLSARKRESVRSVFINAEDGTAGVRAAFEADQVDAAVLWDPDLSLALRKPGSHVVYSTKTATDLIYDVIVCDSDVLEQPGNRMTITNFVAGWMAGVDRVEKDRNAGVAALKSTETMFDALAKKEGDAFVASLFDNIDLTNLADNARILGRVGGNNSYERVYRQFDGIYRGLGALANPNSAVVNPSASFDYRFVDALLQEQTAALVEAAKPQFTFTTEGASAAAAKPAAVTKPVTVNFDTGSAALSRRAQQTIDEGMVPLIEANGAAYFEVSGNTDSTGSAAANKRLSTARALAVTDYLVHEWEFDRTRFVVTGNGSEKPLCDEGAPEDGLTLDDCRAANRATRLAVLNR